jgi:hypothetical protein
VRPPERRYTFEQIVSAGRWAWASSKGSDRPDLYFDGSQFWQQGGRQVKSAPIETLPQDGWWHARDCLCELCRPGRI